MEKTFRLEDVPMAADRNAGWRAVRAAGEVVRTVDDMWILTSLEAVQFAHRNPEIFSSARATDSLMSPVPLIPLGIDPPEHKRFRRILDPMLAPRVIDQLEDELRAQVRELIEAFARNGRCDVVTDLARLYPTQVFLTLFGMPVSDRDRFIEWVETIVENVSPAAGTATQSPEVANSALALFGYLQGHVEKKRASPGDDLLSRILALEGEDAWTNEEVLGLSFLFTLAGLDTVSASIGFIFLHLARRPDLRRRLVTEPETVMPIIEEILRLELPAPTTPRVTTREVEVCGTTIPEGARVMICLATANRDTKRFPSGDEIDVDGNRQGHLSFGGGIHRCLGSHLARRELRLVVEEFHRLIPDYEIAEGASPEVVWPSGTLHLKSLPLEFVPS